MAKDVRIDASDSMNLCLKWEGYDKDIEMKGYLLSRALCMMKMIELSYHLKWKRSC